MLRPQERMSLFSVYLRPLKEGFLLYPSVWGLYRRGCPFACWSDVSKRGDVSLCVSLHKIFAFPVCCNNCSGQSCGMIKFLQCQYWQRCKQKIIPLLFTDIYFITYYIFPAHITSKYFPKTLKKKKNAMVSCYYSLLVASSFKIWFFPSNDSSSAAW